MRDRFYRWFSWFCLVAGLGLLLSLLLIVIQGGEWTAWISINNPKKRMLMAFLALAGWVFTRKGTAPLQDWKAKTGRIVLAGAGLLAAAAVSEAALRAMLDRNQGDGSPIGRLAELPEDVGINLQSFHPLAAIVSLSSNKQLVYELRPNLDMEFGHRILKTNRHGMRESRDYALEKPIDVLRIVGIGDSGMFGWDVDQGEDYLSVLEQRLRSDGKGLRHEVLNLAVPGYNSAQQVEMLSHRGVAFRPDVVVVGWCDNDFNLPFFMTQPVDYGRTDVSFLYHLLFNREVFGRLVDPPALRGSEIDRDLVDPALAEYAGVEGVTRAFAEMQALGAEHGFRLLVFGPMNAHAVGIFEKLGIDYFNTHVEIRKGEHPADYAVHFMHPNPDGHRVLGEELYSFLKEKGWLSAL